MNYREATINDIKQIQVVRNSVKESMLSDPAFVPDHDVEDFITNRGKGWVCEIDGNIKIIIPGQTRASDQIN
ncbi:MAG TPA: hypothetical protein VK484_12315 [Ferruginibacter sp.]|nr:hypothetical protein [Ferruginibacter sp.]